MAADLFGQSISEDTVQSAMTTAFSTLAGFETRVADLLAKVSIAHSDESGVRVAGGLHWLHTLSTKLVTWYGVHKKRGTEALRAFGLLSRFTGRLVHDCFVSYFQLHCSHGLCNAHLLRELTFLHEVEHQSWAWAMKRLLLRMHHAVQSQRARAGPPRAVQWTAWTDKYRALLRQGEAENPHAPLTRRRGRPRHSRAQNLLARLRLHQDSVLAFLADHRVPFTNNQAEQDIRMIKVQQKISGSFRTLTGAQQFARVRAYLSTVRKHGRNVFQDTAAVFVGNPFMPTTAE
jgi:transposase